MIARVGKFKFSIRNPSDVIQSTLCRGQHYQEDFLRTIQGICDKEEISNVLVAGAHIGSLAIPIAAHIRGTLFAFEPFKPSFDHLQENIRLNLLPNVQAYNFGLGDRQTTGYFLNQHSDRIANNTGGIHLLTADDLKNGSRSAAMADLSECAEIKTIDGLGLPKLDLMIIDVEGFESELLSGARNTILRDHPIIICEIWGNQKRQDEHMDTSREDVISGLGDWGYKLCSTNGDDAIFKFSPHKTMKVLADFHHTDLFRAFQMLFENRLGFELYRPAGKDYYPNFYWHPIEGEAIGNLSPYNEFDPAKHKSVLPDPVYQAECKVFENYSNSLCGGVLFRWLPLDRVPEVDLMVCTIDRNEERMWKLRQHFGLKCPIIRYTGNTFENIHPEYFDIFLPAYLPDWERYVKSGRKPGILYHPEFDESLYSYSPVNTLGKPILRCFLNFMYHHREPGSKYETWMRYAGYAREIGGLSYMHGVGTPPPTIDFQELNVPELITLEKMGRLDLKDRSTWPDLRWNRGEAPNHPVIASLMKLSNMAVHHKGTEEGYGFVIHQLASSGRPVVVTEHYRTISACYFLQHRETCIYITGNDQTDRENLHWALQPDNNERMGETIHRRFKEHVNFEDEANRIKALL